VCEPSPFLEDSLFHSKELLLQVLPSVFVIGKEPPSSVFQLGFQKGRVLVLKKGSLVRCWFSKKAFFRDTVKSNKVYNEILTFIIYT
jgi:hypothetical protein